MGHRPSIVDTAPERRTGAIATALATPRRRALLEYLVGTDREGVRVRTLAAALHEIAVARDGAPFGPDRRRTDVALHHVDLPKLQEAGIIDYDPGARRVTLVRPQLAEAALSVTEEC